VKKDEPCRFCRIYAIAVVALAAFVGVVTAFQYGLGLGKFGGHEYMMRVVLLSSLRSLGPGVAGSALLIAFVVWAHPLPVARLEAELPRFLKRGALISGPGYLVAAAVSIALGLVVANLAFSVPWSFAGRAFTVAAPRDVGLGLFATALDTALIVFLASRYLVRLQAGRSSLPMKLILAWTFGTGLRLTVGLLGSLLSPA
jgi:Permease MlaE